MSIRSRCPGLSRWFVRRRTTLFVMIFCCLCFLLWSHPTIFNYGNTAMVALGERRIQVQQNNTKDSRPASNSDQVRNNIQRVTKTNTNFTYDPNAFEPEVDEDFPTVDSDNPRIPHILHIVFITGIKDKQGVPGMYKDNVMSFIKFHPNWTIYFWSDQSARDLVAKRQPDFLPTYDRYKRVILKADALRYILLYEFGGVYTDVDMSCMRPLDRATMKYACILTPEPFEHSSILYKLPYFFSNALMLCRAKHPFFKQLIEELPKTAHFKGTLEAAGTKFFTTQFSLYTKIKPNEVLEVNPVNVSGESSSPYFYHGVADETRDDAIYVANTHYFMSSYDFKSSQLKNACRSKRDYNKEKILKRGCILISKTRNKKTKNQFSFTDHYWKHMYTIQKTTSMVPIQSLSPNIKFYNASSDKPL